MDNMIDLQLTESRLHRLLNAETKRVGSSNDDRILGLRASCLGGWYLDNHEAQSAEWFPHLTELMEELQKRNPMTL